ncbi:hypothetical protein ACPOL_2731 [Acidisarcina polymorpha]|uniref:Uncharacterized protein n=1 Tax=Acidisarcina polymorpha TaxID=2211140 RepID=A0A2Z5FZU2_9BACT|nr:hypothetical protein ACPOL_2731 [Acidisarcina polymorpha]
MQGLSAAAGYHLPFADHVHEFDAGERMRTQRTMLFRYLTWRTTICFSRPAV